MIDTQDIRSRIEPYGPRAPLEELVQRLNQFYHACEARDYDRNHPEIHVQLEPYWNEMIGCGLPAAAGRAWRVLDFGCGTGFEAVQLLRVVGRDNIAEFVCHDPSPEMLDHCRARIGPHVPHARFTSSAEELAPTQECFDVLLTNSLLHHLPDPLGTIRALSPLLAEDAVWLAGHEPSNRFFRNPECHGAYARYLEYRKVWKYFSPSSYVTAAKRALGCQSNPAKVAAAAALREGLFKQMPPQRLVQQLVDFHVPRSADEAEAGKGFDFHNLRKDFEVEWDLVWTKSYSFMGTFPEYRLSARWVKECRALQERFPDDGANFCAVWKRCLGNNVNPHN